MKSHGRVPTILPISRAFTFAVIVRPTTKAIPAIMNGELKEMQAEIREKKGSK